MNRKLFIILVVIAVALYSYVAFLLTGGSLSSTVKKEIVKNEKKVNLDKLVLNSAMVHFENRGRDPFIPYKEIPVNLITKEKPKEFVAIAPKKEPPKPPSIAITGIMWNPTSPVAMVTLPGGTSTIAKAGITVGDITFKKIEKNRIQITSGGKDFWIDR
jgi:hypothetical protein